jgi:hypothetical protein
MTSDGTVTQPPVLTSLLRQLSVEAATGHIDYDSKMAIKTTLLNEASQAVRSSVALEDDATTESGTGTGNGSASNRYQGPLAELYLALDIATRSGVIKSSTHEHVTHLLHSSHSIVPSSSTPTMSSSASSSLSLTSPVASYSSSSIVRWSNLPADVFSLLFSLMDGMCSPSSSHSFDVESGNSQGNNNIK